MDLLNETVTDTTKDQDLQTLSNENENGNLIINLPTDQECEPNQVPQSLNSETNMKVDAFENGDKQNSFEDTINENITNSSDLARQNLPNENKSIEINLKPLSGENITSVIDLTNDQEDAPNRKEGEPNPNETVAVIEVKEPLKSENGTSVIDLTNDQDDKPNQNETIAVIEVNETLNSGSNVAVSDQNLSKNTEQLNIINPGETKDENDKDVVFFHDYGRRESSDSEEDSDSSISVLSVASVESYLSVNAVDELENSQNTNKKKGKSQKNPPLNKTPGELGLEDLPPIEDLHITVPEKDIHHIGKVSSIVSTQVIIQSFEDERPLDLDSVLFLKDGTALGKVFDVFGRVAAPFYSVRFNCENDIKEKGIGVSCNVYCAPTHGEVTKFVFTEKLLTQKGSDASWKDNNEPPEECLEFSDDEQERFHKMKLKAKRKGEDIDLQIVHTSVNKRNSKSPNRNRGNVIRPNRFSAPTPDLNAMASQERFNQQNNGQVSNGSFRGNQSNPMWGNNIPQQNSNGRGYNPAWLPNPFALGGPNPLFNNSPLTVNPAYYRSPPMFGNYFQPGANNQAPVWQPSPNFGQQVGPQSNLQNPYASGQFQPPMENNFFNFCFTPPPPPPPPPN